MGESRLLSELDQSTYYSSWHYVAIHVAASLPGLNSVRLIASTLLLPEDIAREVILFLFETGILTGILTGKDSELRPGLTQIHLSRQSPMIRQTGVRPSPEEGLYGFNLDFYSVLKQS